MAVDIQRVVLAAVEAALGDDKRETKNKGLSAGKAVAVGAMLVTAVRIAAKPGGRFVKEKLRESLSDGSDSDEEDAYDQDDAYDKAGAEEDQEPEAEEDKRAAAEAREEDEANAAEDPEGGPGSDDKGPNLDDEVPDEPEPEGDEDDVGDVEDESDARSSKTRPRPPMFDRPGASGSKIRPSARPPSRTRSDRAG